MIVAVRIERDKVMVIVERIMIVATELAKE